MPEQLGRGHAVQLALLILCVPLQFFLTRTSNESDRQFQIKKVITGLSELSHSILDFGEWRKWCGDMWGRIVGVKNSTDDATPPEVLKNRAKHGHFATSEEPRSPRPPHVKFRIGQVVKHKQWGYRGVIVGWDETAKAPEAWLKEMHPKDKPEWQNLPNYAVLVDTRDRLTPQMSYVVQENIEVVSNLHIFHPLVDHYFENFDGAQYLARPWLKKTYPHD